LIGDAGCETDAQCGTIGVGAKACGGPSSYLAWSRLHTDAAALQAAAQQEEAAQRKAMQARGEMSTCSVVTDPGAWCDRTAAPANAAAGVCRLRSPGRNGLPAIR